MRKRKENYILILINTGTNPTSMTQYKKNKYLALADMFVNITFITNMLM